MNVELILVVQSGIITMRHVIEKESTAEKIFDDIANSFLKDEYKEIESLTDYADKLVKLNELINPLGKEVIWFTQIKVNSN